LSASAFAATVGLGANLGLFGLAQPDSPVGRLDPGPPHASAHAIAHQSSPPTSVAPTGDADD
jgi:hypothetical protein